MIDRCPLIIMQFQSRTFKFITFPDLYNKTGSNEVS